MVVFSPIIVQDTKKIYGYNFIAPLKVLKARKKKLALTSFYYVSWEIWLGNSKKLICIDQSRFSHTHENSKIFNITSKYFSFFNNKPPASWVAHITRDFLTCYSTSYYSSMLLEKCPNTEVFLVCIFPYLDTFHAVLVQPFRQLVLSFPI